MTSDTLAERGAPERIWVWTYKMGAGEMGAWDVDPEEAPPKADRYILATPTALSASPEVAKLIAEAEARVMRIAASLFPGGYDNNFAKIEAAAIRKDEEN